MWWRQSSEILLPFVCRWKSSPTSTRSADSLVPIGTARSEASGQSASPSSKPWQRSGSSPIGPGSRPKWASSSSDERMASSGWSSMPDRRTKATSCRLMSLWGRQELGACWTWGLDLIKTSLATRMWTLLRRACRRLVLGDVGHALHCGLRGIIFAWAC